MSRIILVTFFENYGCISIAATQKGDFDSIIDSARFVKKGMSASYFGILTIRCLEILGIAILSLNVNAPAEH